MYNLYERENKIVKLVLKKLKKYGINTKERLKKENELFHMLCFLDINNNLKIYNKIKPNEPGDFLIKSKNKKIMIEVVTCFGNDKTNIYIQDKLDKVFKRKTLKIKNGLYNFTIIESKNMFKKIFNNKNNKQYIVNNKFDKKILLLVTGEYDNCPITGSWFEKKLNEKDLSINKYDNIWILNYFSNGKDNGPTIMTNGIEQIKGYHNI